MQHASKVTMKVPLAMTPREPIQGTHVLAPPVTLRRKLVASTQTVARATQRAAPRRGILQPLAWTPRLQALATAVRAQPDTRSSGGSARTSTAA